MKVRIPKQRVRKSALVLDEPSLAHSEETMKRTWAEFEDALARKEFEYTDTDKALSVTFLRQFDGWFQCIGKSEMTVSLSEIFNSKHVGRGTIIKPSEPQETPPYNRLLPVSRFITEDNRFSPPGVEWLYLAVGESQDIIQKGAEKECRAKPGERFALCNFKINTDYSNLKVVDLTIADKMTYNDINKILKELEEREYDRAFKYVEVLIGGFMIDVFLILVSTFVVFGISFSLQLLQKKHNNKRGISLNYDEYLSIDLILFLFLSIALMLLIVYISLYEFKTEVGKLLNDSGLLLACSLLIIGKVTCFLFSKIRRRLKLSQTSPNTTISFLLSSLIHIVILARLGATKSALTFIALIIGKFIWFDTTKDGLKNDLRDLLNQIKIYPLATTFMFISILIGVVVGNDILLGIVFWGNLLSLITFLFYMRSTKKDSNDISNQ